MLIKRELKNAANDLKTVYRPYKVDELLGNTNLKSIISKRLDTDKLTHTMLFSGPAGTGKTTMARIVALSLNCTNTDKPSEPCLTCNSCKSILNQSSMDYQEVNVGADSGKADVEAIVKDLSFSAFSLKNKVIIFDECHKLTTAAKDLLLKVMEDTYAHVYLIFCTNEPEKLKNNKKDDNPFLDRCDHFVFEKLTDDEIFAALENVCQFEGVPYNIEVLNYIVEVVKGVPRKALGSLGAVISDGSWDLNIVKQILSSEAVSDDIPEAIDLCRSLFKAQFKDSINNFSKLIRKYGVESIRITVCGYFVGCLKKATSISKASKISASLDVLLVPIYLSGKPAEHIFYNYIFKVVKIMSVN
jgi:DNA polymerase-3 subunit gamma/tau